MDSFVLGAQLLLAAIFATAGIAKLLDRPGSRGAIGEFGVPARLLPAVAFLLPLFELATATALVFPPSAGWGAVAALGLLLAFIAGIGNALFRGRSPDCHCFGQLHSSPAGRATLVRNGVLAVLAGIIIINGPAPAIDTWIADRTGSELVAVGLGVPTAVAALVCGQLWLDNRRLRRDLEHERETVGLFPPGLPVGALAPEFNLPDLRGEVVSLESLLGRRRPLVLVFVSASCGPCASLFPELSRWQSLLGERLTIALISSGEMEENRRVVAEHGLVDLVVQKDSEVMDAYRVDSTPSAVSVRSDGRVASVAAEGPHAIEPLIRLTLRRATADSKAVSTGDNGARLQQAHSAS